MYSNEPEEIKQWDLDHYKRICKSRCIQVIDEPSLEYIDYHKVLNQEDQEDLNGAYLVDHIIEQRFFPNGRWDSV